MLPEVMQLTIPEHNSLNVVLFHGEIFCNDTVMWILLGIWSHPMSAVTYHVVAV